MRTLEPLGHAGQMKTNELILKVFPCFWLLGALTGSLIQAASPNLGGDEVPVSTLKKRTSVILQCDVGCDEQKRPTGYAKLSWSGVNVKGENARLDFTVFSVGFKAGVFATFELRNQKWDPKLSRAIEGPRFRAFEVRIREIVFSQHENSIASVLVENLEPGLNHQWRLMTQTNEGWVSSKEAVCEAPVCI